MIQILLAALMWAFAPIPWLMTALHILIHNDKWQTRTARAIVGTTSIAVWTLLALWLESDHGVLFRHHFDTSVATLAGIAVLAIAAVIEIATARALGRKRILGSSELHNAQDELISSGIYRYARHPRYVEHPLWFVGLGLAFGYPSMLWFALYLFIALAITARFEERELRRRYGRDYVDYAAETPAFFVGARRRR